jgi:hypothetical protein
MNAFAKTKLVADTSLISRINSLKKREGGRVIPVYVRYAFVAAVAAGLMLVIFMRGMPWETQDVVSPVAVQSSPSSSSSQQSHKDSNTTASEIERPSNVKNSDLASARDSNSTNKNLADKGHHKNNSANKEDSHMVAVTSPTEESNPYWRIVKIRRPFPLI